ncbi:MAG: sulfite exporter TauE/SafE family protein [Desulfovibrionaceae bacterium]
MHDLPLVSAVTLLAGFIHGLTGFGYILVALPLLAFAFPIRSIVPATLLAALAVNLVLAWGLRGGGHRRELAILFVAVVPATLAGTRILSMAPEVWLMLLLGVCLTAHGALGLSGWRPRRSPGGGWAAAAGVASGLLGGSIGAGGPPVILYASAQPWPKEEIKGLMTSFFVGSGVVACAAQAAAGLVDGAVLRLLAEAAPGTALGLAAGMALFRRVSTRRYQRLVLALILVLGAIFLTRSAKIFGLLP